MLINIFENVFNPFGAGNYSISYLKEFYHDKGQNLDQLYLSVIYGLSKNDNWLEDNHRFIQWLFPLNECSKFNASAPVLSKSQIGTLKKDEVFQENLVQSFWIMMHFYGFEYRLQEDNSEKLCLIHMNRAHNHWLKEYDHNHLRISRILDCLDLFERNDLSKIFRFELKNTYEKYGTINSETIKYWKLYESI